MPQEDRHPDDVPLRPPEQVMRLARMGASHQTRLSFARVLLRRLTRERWQFDRPRWDIDGQGYGVAVSSVQSPQRTYSLVAFSAPLAPELRTDRVIAEAWDTTYVLFDGIPDDGDIVRLREVVPKQEAGRFLESELVLSRANKSLRLFEAVVSALAAGQQPDAALIDRVGYLMRTTAVYGNGKFGLADHDILANRPELSGPFHAQMLTVWLIRAFTADLVEHLARARAPQTAVAMEPALRRRLGVGNATGLGMAPFLVRHPSLISRWVGARETALARVRSLPVSGAAERAHFRRALRRFKRGLAAWRPDDEIQAGRNAALATELSRLSDFAVSGALEAPFPWDRLTRFAEEGLSLEGQELAVSLALEPHGALIDDLADAMVADEASQFRINGTMSVGALRGLIERLYGWALGIDFDAQPAQARFWYTSSEKLEPRLGERALEPGGDLELPLGAGRDAALLYKALHAADPAERVAAFLIGRPDMRHSVRRAQILSREPYAEIRDNLLDAEMRPIDLLRAKLAFFGATRFDPRSDRWVRISLFQGAPFPHEISMFDDDGWILGPDDRAFE